MKTNNFQDKIKAYLDKRAAEDSLFAVTYAKKNKNINECFSYIMGEVLKASVNINAGAKGCQIEDDEVYSMAVHYYDEDGIKISKLPANVKAVANNSAPKTELKKEATKTTIKPKKKEDVGQLSLF